MCYNLRKWYNNDEVNIMLINFAVTNYGPFRDRVSFSMESGEKLTKFKETNVFSNSKISILKSAIIFGANGSGKTNFLQALRMFRHVVVSPTNNITKKLLSNTFSFDEESKKNPTIFEIRILINDVIYNYFLSYTKDSIIQERLEYSNRNKMIIHFERGVNIDSVPENLADEFSKLRPNSLLLYNGQNINDEHCINVFHWFSENLVFFNEGIDDELYNLLQSDKNRSAFVKFLKCADQNIVDINVAEKKSEYPQKIKKIIEIYNDTVEENEKLPLDNDASYKELYTSYYRLTGNKQTKKKVNLNINKESSGTIKLIELGLLLLATKNIGKTIIIDEFTNSFHYVLAQSVLRIFNSRPNGNQFILSSHEYDLIDEDLRIDQVYFIEKDEKGISTMTSLFDFEGVRQDISLAKQYIRGRFSSVPIINPDDLIYALFGEQ